MPCARAIRQSARAFALLLALWLLPALAGEDLRAQANTPFGIRTAYVQLVDDVYLLNARLHLAADDRLKAVLADGVPLTLELEIEVSRARRYWTDDVVASLAQRYQLQYHAVSDRYVLRNLNSGEQTTFPMLEAALESLARVSGLPVLDQGLIDAERRYEFSMRATLDVGDMPEALRILLFWVDDWHRVSEWYTWPLLQ